MITQIFRDLTLDSLGCLWFFFFFWAEIMQIHLCYIHDHKNLSMLHARKSSNPKLSGLCSNLCYKDEHRDLIETFTTFELC